MNEEIYEVERDQYVGLVGEMKQDCFDMEKEYQEQDIVIKLVSKKTGELITKRIIHKNSNEQYYIYKLPDAEERLASKIISQYKLETKEEVQTFFDILNKLQRGEKE